MKLVHKIAEAREVIKDAKKGGKTIGLVPTMGALHQGHLTLVANSSSECDFTAVSIFVNPTQFGPNEDFDKYPRTLGEDARKCEEAGVDLIFAPSASEMYDEGFDAWVEIGGVTEVFEGKTRPGHFKGVATVCTKLFNIIQPDKAYFGVKDYQQLKVIQKMVKDLNMPLEIRPVDIVREADGLAMSSRNKYLSREERRKALVLSKSLRLAKEAYDNGERNPDVLQKLVYATISAEKDIEIDYASIVDAEKLTSIKTIDASVVILLAVKEGTTRLIDNIVLK